MEIREAIAVLKKDAEEERNWRSARLKSIEVLETVERGARELAEQEQREQEEVSHGSLLGGVWVEAL